MKALFCYDENNFRIKKVEKPKIAEDEMLIELIYCGLCGSDIVKIFNTNGEKPSIYGHEVVGRVVEIGSKVIRFRVGDMVVVAHHIPCGKCHYCIHGNHGMCTMFKETNIHPGGFSQYIKLSSQHIKNTTFLISKKQDLLRALFVEPLACCIRAMDRMYYIEGDIFSVVGAGVMGILFTQLIKLAGLKVLVIDLDDKRLLLAKDLGADYIINPSKGFLLKKIKDITSKGVDSVVLTVTNKHTVTDAIEYVRDGGEINIFGTGLSEESIPVDFNKIYKRELTVRSTYSATPATLSRAFDLIVKDRKIEVTKLISKVLPMSQFKKGLDNMLQRKIYKAIYEF